MRVTGPSYSPEFPPSDKTIEPTYAKAPTQKSPSAPKLGDPEDPVANFVNNDWVPIEIAWTNYNNQQTSANLSALQKALTQATKDAPGVSNQIMQDNQQGMFANNPNAFGIGIYDIGKAMWHLLRFFTTAGAIASTGPTSAQLSMINTDITYGTHWFGQAVYDLTPSNWPSSSPSQNIKL